ncbi:rhodanese-like domain-containing protein [Psychrobium sp. MM17-31]|uniref:rhodanese-like domain-containing protein n=1 Tax=Psychrobium sp. MM17-31 TaxID=2917758 RepID=UPI001EF4ABF7|nr:rhodanese-like domain-containing protein [Psychrobium sp. MM17-31]MCG7532678.1 rhodanese-like domain-containing protein [Psychrobium sp. MM17-31]
MQEYVEFFQANIWLTAAWVILFIAVVVTSIRASINGIKKVNHQQATMMMNREDAVVLDVRGEGEYKKGHILGSKLVPLSKFKNNDLASIEKYKDTPIIVVCNSGMTSNQACQMLQKLGFNDLYNLQGGITEWRNANLPLTKK